jgi:hypothetical protein
MSSIRGGRHFRRILLEVPLVCPTEQVINAREERVSRASFQQEHIP